MLILGPEAARKKDSSETEAAVSIPKRLLRVPKCPFWFPKKNVNDKKQKWVCLASYERRLFENILRSIERSIECSIPKDGNGFVWQTKLVF